MSTSFSYSWQLGPFIRSPKPLISPSAHLHFRCPVRGTSLAWAAKDVFNPGAVVMNDKVWLLVRAEDREGRFSGTSRIGLASSSDGLHFELHPEPVIYPAQDDWIAWEWEGGCEDPRVVESPDGGFVCYYSAFDGKSCVLFVATSDDLLTWKKLGPAFLGTVHAKRWSKSGSVVTEKVKGRLVASRIKGKYWMYWGEGTCYAATSDDLIRWQPVEYTEGDGFLTYTKSAAGQNPYKHFEIGRQASLRPLLHPRPHRFDSHFVEPGPPALKTENGILLIYNGANSWDAETADPALPPGAYTPGQVLFDPLDPLACIARAVEPSVALSGGDSGQFPNAAFAEGLVLFKGQYFLYFGMGDSKIGCAIASA